MAIELCSYCPSPATQGDHAIARSRGGQDGENVVPACAMCNSQKGAKTPAEFYAWLVARGFRPLFLGNDPAARDWLIISGVSHPGRWDASLRRFSRLPGVTA